MLECSGREPRRAAQWARQFWQTAADDARISAAFRAICAGNLVALQQAIAFA